MTKLAARNVFDGSATPAPTVADMKKALGDQRDFLVALLGDDSDDKAGARSAFGVPSIVDEQSGKSKFAIADGTGDAMTATFTPALLEWRDGMEIRVRCKGANTLAAPTLKADGLDPLVIVGADGTPLPPGAYSANWPATFRYRAPSSPAAAKFELLNPVLLLPATSPEVRQTVLQGVTNSSGYANMLSPGTGRALNLAATAVPMRTAFSQAAADFIATLSADATGVVANLPASNLSFITQDYVNSTAVTWGSTLAPPQYGYGYNQAAQAVLHFGGAAGSTSMLDDFGNVWTAQGGAKIQTNQSAFGGSGLGGIGANNSLNGTTDYVKSSIQSPGQAGRGWTLRTRKYLTAYSANDAVFGGTSGLNQGVYVNGSGKCVLVLSSTANGDIANNTGTVTVPLNAWVVIELTYDPVAGKYFLYVGGNPDLSITSNLQIGSWGGIGIGCYYAGGLGLATGYLDEFEFLPYCDHPAGAAYAVPTAAANIAAPGYASDFYSIPNKTMYQVSGASAAAGANPTFTPKNRVYVGEAVAGASSISSVVNYALCGRTRIQQNSLAAGSAYAFTTAIGSRETRMHGYLECVIADLGFSPGDRVPMGGSSTGGSTFYGTYLAQSGNSTLILTYNAGIACGNKAGAGSGTPFNTANWRAVANIERAF